MSLAASCLPISKYRCIFALHQLVYVIPSNTVVYLLLCSEFTADTIETKLVTPIIDHSLIVLQCRRLARLEATVYTNLRIILGPISLFLLLQPLHLDDLIN
jgi:hypothetical protein